MGTSKTLMSLRKGCLLVAFFMASIASMAQEATQDKPKFFPKLFRLNKSFSVGIIGGTAGHFDYGMLGFNATVYGAYVDFMGWPRKRLKSVGIDQTERLATWACHAGYQIPFHQYQDGSIRFIPMIGFYSVREGFALDGYKASTTTGNFDYGAALTFQRKDNKIGSYNFYIAYTRYTAWIGLGIEFPFR